jgi:hypothetical protein
MKTLLGCESVTNTDAVRSNPLADARSHTPTPHPHQTTPRRRTHAHIHTPSINQAPNRNHTHLMSPTWATNAGNRLEVGSCSSVATRCCTKGATPGVSPMSAPLAVHVGHPNTPSMPMSAYCSREGEGGFGRGGRMAVQWEGATRHRKGGQHCTCKCYFVHYWTSQTLVGEGERGNTTAVQRAGGRGGGAGRERRGSAQASPLTIRNRNGAASACAPGGGGTTKVFTGPATPDASPTE